MIIVSLLHFTRFGSRAVNCAPFGLHELPYPRSRSIKKQEELDV
jgi:hypothetical protein